MRLDWTTGMSSTSHWLVWRKTRYFLAQMRYFYVFLAWVGLPRSPSLWGPSFLVCGARKSLLCNLLHPHNNAPLLERHLQRNFCQFLRYLRTKRSGCGAQKTKFRAPQNRPRSSCKSNFHLHTLFTPPHPTPPNSFASTTPCAVPALSVIARKTAPDWKKKLKTYTLRFFFYCA